MPKHCMTDGFRGRMVFVAARSLLACLLLLNCSESAAQTTTDDTIEIRLQQQLQADPDNATAWRLLGRIRLQRGHLQQAHDAFERAITLSPLSAAARFDMGRVLLKMDQPADAGSQFENVLTLAPDSPYATRARDLLEQVNEGEGVVQAQYETRRFDGSAVRESATTDDSTPPDAPASLYELRLETGVLFNSNLALAPLSRELSPDDSSSFQGFISPDLQLSLIDQQTWRAGTTFRGNFNWNEGHYREFNLQSYRPGLFAEWFHFHGSRVFIPRVAYEFTHDEFDRQTFGNRHALVTSLVASWNETQSSFFYWSIDNSEFLNDGTLPSVTSQDGWTNAVGASHDYLLNCGSLQRLRVGTDFTLADARGTDYRFHGLSLYSEIVLAITKDTELTIQGGWGYRNYPDFEFTPSRNENIWRAGLELRKWLRDDLSAALVFNYDRFASKNVLFEAERYVTGVVTTFEY